MLALAIDTSTPMVSVAVVRRSVPLARQDELVHNAHGEVLAALVERCLREAAALPADLDVIGVGLGPGPFTGLRVGIVTAAAMAEVLDVPAYGMCSLDSTARRFATDEVPFAVVTDARRRQVYWATYSENGTRVDGPEICTPAELAEHLHGRVGEIAGSAAQLRDDMFATYRVIEDRWPDTHVIAEEAVRRLQLAEQPEPLRPLYLRRPDARPPGTPKKVTPA